MSKVALVYGEINFDSYKKFRKAAGKLLAQNSSCLEIELSSCGGDTYAGLAFYGLISSLKKNGTTVTIRCYGAANSAASIILASGNHRIMQKDAWFLVHDDVDDEEGDYPSKVVERSEEAQKERMEVQWSEILARHSKIPAPKWRQMSKKTTYLSAKECLELGVIDEIV